MTDYIKREDIVNLAVMMQTHLWTREQTYNAIFCLPSADVAPVVRCKDCKHWDEHSQYGYDNENGVYGNYCMLWTPEDDFYAVETPEDGFCYCGERKDDE